MRHWCKDFVGTSFLTCDGEVYCIALYDDFIVAKFGDDKVVYATHAQRYFI